MSAYICDKEHFVYLMCAAMSRRIAQHGFSYYHDGDSHSLRDGDFSTAADAANMLLRENIKSVSARYPNESSASLPGPTDGVDPITPRDIRDAQFFEFKPVQVLKACDCLEYQSCEHDAWEQSEAHALLQRLRSAAWHALPGYDDAEWGAPKVESESKVFRLV